MRKVLAIILWAEILFCWQPLWGQAPGVGVKAGNDQEQQGKLAGAKPQDDQRGTENSPLIVESHNRPKTDKEAAEEKADNSWKHYIDTWTVSLALAVALLTGFLVIIGWRGVRAAVRTLSAIERQADLMDRQATEARESTAQQMRDVQASIAEATRASKAMEGIAESMASNVESVRTSVGISREIADMQKLATELQSRAYLSALFNTAIFQDANHVFEVRAILRNHGNTPAYDVTFRAACQIVPLPLPDDFAFPLPDETAGTSVSFMAPQTTKLVTRSIAGRVPDAEAEAIKLGVPPQCLAMWGVVSYRDAFGKTRHTRFAFTVNWIPWVPGMDRDRDGNPLLPQSMSHDTARHNDAD